MIEITIFPMNEIKTEVLNPNLNFYGDEENRNKKFYLGAAIKQRLIDGSIGRNVMLNFLRFKGYLTSSHKPVPGSEIYEHLSPRKLEEETHARVKSLPYHQLDITGEGLCQIIRAIALNRREGGTI